MDNFNFNSWFFSEPSGMTSPKLLSSTSPITVNTGVDVILPCAAEAWPTPTYM